MESKRIYFIDLPNGTIIYRTKYGFYNTCSSFKIETIEGNKCFHYCSRDGKLDNNDHWEILSGGDTGAYIEDDEEIIYPHVRETPLYKAIYGE